MRMIDLCSGLGGASEAFVQAGWEVLRIDNNPMMSGVPHTKEMSIFDFEDWVRASLPMLPKPKLVWFSPPCLEFSTAYNAPKSVAQRAGQPFEPDMDIFECGLRIIAMLEPRYFVVENVRGAIEYFSPVLGEPVLILQGSYFLWGRFPGFSPGSFPSKAEKDKRHSPIRSNIRAKVPIEISESLLKAIESQTSLFDFK